MWRRRRRLVLHIGFHTAGSVVLHESLSHARDGLQERGVVYPTPLADHPSHVDLATALGFNPMLQSPTLDPGRVIDHYHERIDDSPRGTTFVVASDEFCLGNYRPEAMDRLRNFLDKLDVDLTVVASVREPIPFLASIYLRELEETESDGDFTSWLGGFDLDGADFGARLEVWRRLVGPTSEVRLLPFGEDRGPDGGTLDPFLSMVGIASGTVRPITPPSGRLDPRLARALSVARRNLRDPAARRQALDALLEVSDLLDPLDDPVSFMLGDLRTSGASPALLQRLDQLGRPPAPRRDAVAH